MIAVRPDQATDYGQRLDPSVGLVMPWYTHGALDEIASMKLADKVVFEWGGGCSSLWWASKAREVWTVEAHADWTNWITHHAMKLKLKNLNIKCTWPSPLPEYLNTDIGKKIDIIVIDGSERTACLEKALTLPRPLTVIFDNWQQDGVYIDPLMEKVMEPYTGRVHRQADHMDHQGRPWQTAIWNLVPEVE